MEEFGFNKIDEDDIFDPKQSKENMISLYNVENMLSDSNQTSFSDINVNSFVPDIDPADEASVDRTITTNTKTLSEVTIPEGRVNPSPQPLEVQEGNINPTPDAIDFMNEGRVNPLPEKMEVSNSDPNPTGQMSAPVNPLENMATNETLTVETSKNLQVNKQLSFDLKNPNYMQSQPRPGTATENAMSIAPSGSDSFDFEVPEPLATNTASSRKLTRKNAPPEWRTHHG
tara:strand:+ start:8275 stop:8961 length:687 start_codon:yes stop_codon:yes gene_type:complete